MSMPCSATSRFAYSRRRSSSANVSGLPAAIGFAETLMRLGFLHPSTLTALCRAWRTLIEVIAPELAVFDYAPTGLARDARARRYLARCSEARFPCPRAPSRCRSIDGGRASRSRGCSPANASCSAKANEVLARLSQPPMARLADLLDVDESIHRGVGGLRPISGTHRRAILGQRGQPRKGRARRRGRWSARSASSRTSSRTYGRFRENSSRRCARSTPRS